MIITQGNSGHGEVILRTGAAGYEVIVDGQFLMSTSSGKSSQVLVDLGIAKLSKGNPWQVLIAGLGLGFSLQAALSYREVEEVVIVELEEEIINWHRQGLIPGSTGLLNDERVRVNQRDFLEFIVNHEKKYDLIALDIDNGPDWLSHQSNYQLYSSAFLERLHELLKPGGVLTIWSAAGAPAFEQNLAQIFRLVTVTPVNDHNGAGKEIEALIYLASL